MGPVFSHGNSSNLTFPLETGWTFVETEDWRADIEAKWSEVGAEACECFPVVHTAISLMVSVTPQRGGYIQMMRGSSRMLRRWVSGRLMAR